MKRIILFLFILPHCISLLAQNPGGIEGNSYWFSASEKSDSLPTKTNSTINFYPSLSVNDQTVIDEIKSSEDLNELTAFVVLKPAFLQQGYQIVDIDSKNHQLSIQSDKVKSKKDLNIQNYDSDKPYFITYIESFEEENVNDSIKSDSFTKKNHANKFEGEVAEIIFYPKLLSKLKRRKIETYLSLKYGISLPLNSNYINSKNDTIWKKDESKVFLYRVTGIGRDLNGNLDHKQSANVDDYQFLTIGLGNKIEAKNELNKKSWQDLNYLLWADNSGEMVFEKEKQTPKVSLLGRIWKTKIIGEGVNAQNYTFSFETDLIETKENNEEKKKDGNSKTPDLKYWLVFAPDASDKFNINTAEFIQSVSIPKEGEKANFSNVTLQEQKESFLFTIVKAPELFALVKTEEKNCQSDVSLKIIGGTAPYHVEFYSSNNQKFSVIEESDQKFNVSDIPSGTYVCRITDSLNQTFEQEIIITADVQNTLMIDDVFVKEGNSHSLDLDQIIKEPISDIIWLKDNQEIAIGKKLTLREEGQYNIQYLTEKGCRQTTSFVVTKIPAVEWSGIYPNPVKINEPFFVNLNNTAMSEVKLTITDFSGRIVKTKTLKEGSEIYSDSFYQQGTYIIMVETTTEKNQYTLIVK